MWSTVCCTVVASRVKTDSIRQLCWSTSSCQIRNCDIPEFSWEGTGIHFRNGMRMGIKIHTAGNRNSFKGDGGNGNSKAFPTELYVVYIVSMVAVCEAFSPCNSSMLLVLSMSYQWLILIIQWWIIQCNNNTDNTVSLSVFSVYLLLTSFCLYMPYDYVIWCDKVWLK